MTIKCKLLGQQLIEEDGQLINLPQGKLTGLFFYILINKVVSRDEAANLFWPNSNEKRAKTSLRNALHKIRTCFNEDIILSPNKFDLILNEDLDLEIDVNLLEEDPIGNYKEYTGEFLKGLYISDLVEFDYWVNEMRRHYFRIYKNALETKIENDYENESFEDYEDDVNKLVSLDIYNERAYYFKLLYFEYIERFDKVINEYHYYQNMIYEELGVSPSKALKDIYDNAMEIVKSSDLEDKDNEKIFFKREYELKLMEHTFQKYLDNKEYKSILIRGESGIGKSVLVEKFHENNLEGFKYLRVNCNYLETSIPYYPWLKLINMMDEYFKGNNIKSPELWDEMLQSLFFTSANGYDPKAHILENKSNFNVEVIFNALLNGFDSYSEGEKVVVFFDDVHLADKLSIDLLVRFILSSKSDIMFLLTCSDEADKSLMSAFTTLEQINKLIEIILRRFTKQDVASIVYSTLGDDVSKEEIDEIYHKSKGNSFFLNEYINIYSQNETEEKLFDKLDNILKEKFLLLTDSEMNILRILSVFNEAVVLDDLINILNIAPFDVLRSIENLTSLKIIEELNDGNKVKFEFVYSAYKTYIYNSLNESSRKILHLEVANNWEKMISDTHIDISLYNRLEKHYRKGGNKEKALKYKVHKLNYFLNFNHEIFPNINDYEISSRANTNIKNDMALKLIDELEKEIIVIKNQGIKANEENIIDEIEMIFLYCKGRYLIRCGKYDNGIRVIDRLIYLSKELNDKEFEILGRKQLIIYGVQINDKDIMLEHIIPGIRLSKEIGDQSDIGILYRLYGLYHLMIGDFDQAEVLFNESINIFLNSNVLGDQNSISIAANYNYLGEISTAEGKFEQAIKYYKKSIALSEESRPTCISIFYINAGINSFLTGDIDCMREYFLRADYIIDQFDSYWKKPVLDAFLGMINFIDKNYDKSLKFMEDAESEVTTINNPRDIGIVYFVQAIISSLATKDKKLEGKNFLKEPMEYYYYQAMRYLDPYRDMSTIKYLEENIKL